MSVVDSLLSAIERVDGEALVMHVGEKPYVVTANGPNELATNALTVPSMTKMLDQLLPPDSRQALDELGAVEYLPPEHAGGPQYSIVAARGGDDIWIELRRRREAPHVEPAPAPPRAEEPVWVAPEPVPALEPEPEPMPQPVYERAPEPVFDTFAPHAVDEPPAPSVATEYQSSWHQAPSGEAAEVAEPAPDAAPPAEPFELRPRGEDEPYELYREETSEEPVRFEPGPAFDFQATREETPLAPREEAARFEPPPAPAPDFAARAAEARFAEPEPASAVVVPLSRPSPRVADPPPAPSRSEGVLGLLQLAAAHGASALYVAAQGRPSLRVDGEIRVLDEPPLAEAQLEAGLLALSPASDAAQLPFDAPETWSVPEIGRVQCLVFRDHRGLGATFKMLPARAISAEQIGLAAPIQALCMEPEGLVLVAGPSSSGKSTLVAALVDQINRTRRDHVITVEAEIQFVHENRSSFVSQREARDEQAFADQVRAGLRETPDVLVIDGIASPQVARFALQASAAGLVVASVTAPSTAAAVERLLDLLGEDRVEAREALSESLRGVVTQKLLRKTGGGRASAREVLVNVPSVAALLATGQLDQLAAVMNNGRRVGMVPFNDALVGLVQGGALDVREAYRKSPDQQELLEMLNRAGIDTMFAERLA